MKGDDIIKLFSKQKKLSNVLKNLCGQELGRGLYRDVYLFKMDHRYVVKIERDMQQAVFANVTEWRNWIQNKEWTEVGPWMAPCLTINETGQVLIQRRATRLVDKPNMELPSKVPAVFTDRKVFNWGWIGKRFVCFDYSFLLNVPPRLVTANWWGRDLEKHNKKYIK